MKVKIWGLAPLLKTYCACLLWVATPLSCLAQTYEIVLPLAGPALHFTEQAEAAVAQGEFAQARVFAAEALRLRPDATRVKALPLLLHQATHSKVNAPPPQASPVRANPAPLPTAARPAVTNDDEAFSRAQQVYEMIQQGNAKDAVVLANQALIDYPASRKVAIARINALFSNSEMAQAHEAAQAAINRWQLDDELLVLSETIRRQLAETASFQTDQALESQDYTAATQAVQVAIRHAPDIMDNRLLLIQTHLLADQLALAEVAANAALEMDEEDPLPWIFRGYTRQAQGQRADAVADFNHVLNQLEFDRQHNETFRLVMADAALAQADPLAAQAVLQPLLQDPVLSSDPKLKWRLRAAQLQEIQRQAGQPTEPFPLRPLDFSCRAGPYGRACSLLPPALFPDPAYTMASLAYDDLKRKDFAAAARHARWAQMLDTENGDYPLLLAQTLEAQDDLAGAEQVLTEFLIRAPTPAKVLAQRGALRERQDQESLAREDYARALALGSLTLQERLPLMVKLQQRAQAKQLLQDAVQGNDSPVSTPLELAYLALSVGDDALAMGAFGRSDAATPLTSAQLQDAANSAIREKQDAQAITWLKRAVDRFPADTALALRDSPELTSLSQVRRQISELSRHWGGNMTASFRGAQPGVAGAGAASGANESLQIGTELYWRPHGYQNGGWMEWFARTYHTPYNSAGGLTGSDSLQGSAGLRWKPWEDANFIFVLSHQFPLGSRMPRDWLAQVAYSAGEGGEWRPVTPSWPTWQVYAEAGHYLLHPQTYAAGYWRWGRSYRADALGPNVVAFPHLVIAADLNDQYDDPTAAGIGLGVNFRTWLREDRYHAPRSFVDVTLQQRVRLMGDTKRAQGTFLTVQVAY